MPRHARRAGRSVPAQWSARFQLPGHRRRHRRGARPVPRPPDKQLPSRPSGGRPDPPSHRSRLNRSPRVAPRVVKGAVSKEVRRCAPSPHQHFFTGPHRSEVGPTGEGRAGQTSPRVGSGVVGSPVGEEVVTRATAPVEGFSSSPHRSHRASGGKRRRRNGAPPVADRVVGGPVSQVRSPRPTGPYQQLVAGPDWDVTAARRQRRGGQRLPAVATRVIRGTVAEGPPTSTDAPISTCRLRSIRRPALSGPARAIRPSLASWGSLLTAGNQPSPLGRSQTAPGSARLRQGQRSAAAAGPPGHRTGCLAPPCGWRRKSRRS